VDGRQGAVVHPEVGRGKPACCDALHRTRTWRVQAETLQFHERWGNSFLACRLSFSQEVLLLGVSCIVPILDNDTAVGSFQMAFVVNWLVRRPRTKLHECRHF
jgi:hypothetical protein